ncbi:MAG TPA: HAMP domain-containing sensor histidine kinase, partial [Candidatus Krumholzibacterium sp.]|nr:HAMP domain-containing sensor histidine kinase [Candidatus Krumholzibacterium sp.]
MKIELLEAVKDEKAMKDVLLRMMERAGAEFCAYFSGTGDQRLDVLIDSRELSPRLPEIREKVIRSFRMFANRDDEPSYYTEKVYYRTKHNNISYLIGISRIESYFLVPVLFDSTVMGVLFFGSVREDAFVRETISYFDSMAGEDEMESGMMYMLRGDLAVVSSMIDQIPLACALLSPRGEIVHANTMFSSVLGLEGAVPENLEELSRMTGYPLTGAFSEFRITGRIDSRELCADGERPGYVAVDITRLAKITSEVSSIMVLRDISPVKDLERSTEEMLAMVAHELRTPMTGLRNSLRLMLGSGPSRGNAEGLAQENRGITRFLDTALRTVDRLSTLVDGIVDTSSIRSNDRKPDFSEVDTEAFLRDSCRIFQGTFVKKEISLHLGIAEGAGKMFVDYGMMSQVIQNLVSNSLKKVPSGGRIRIEVSIPDGPAGDGVSALPGSLIRDARYTRIRILDTGPGIPGEVAERINSSMDETEVRRTSFKGLGIHISGRLIELHGGRLKAHARDDEGGSIEIVVPADRPTSRAVLSVRESMRAFRRMVS